MQRNVSSAEHLFSQGRGQGAGLLSMSGICALWL